MKTVSNDIFDVAATVAPADGYRFLGVAGSATFTGYYIDQYGLQTGRVFSLTIPQGNGTNDPVTWTDGTYVENGASVTAPEDAVGVEGVLSVDVYRAKCGSRATELADFKEHHASYPKEISLSPLPNVFGRVR